MSTNISNIRRLSGRLVLPLRNVAAARALLEESGTPEGVLPPLKSKGWGASKVTFPDDADLSLDRLSWCHDFSGRSWGYSDAAPDAVFPPDAPFVRFIALTEGTADFLVVWEGGADFTGLHVEGGKAYRREVEFVLK